MNELKYPNETSPYREARAQLLEEEIALIDRVKEVAAKRRALPLGGILKDDYVFTGANDNNLGSDARFSELFGDKTTLLLYSYMFGPNWDKPCPSCTSLVDGFDRAAISVNQTTAFAVVAKATASQLNTWASGRGWEHITLISAENNSYLKDYLCQQGDDDSALWPAINVFVKRDDAIHHFWGSEMQGNGMDMIWPYWNLMDMTPEGRPNLPASPQNFESKFIEKHYTPTD